MSRLFYAVYPVSFLIKNRVKFIRLCFIPLLKFLFIKPQFTKQETRTETSIKTSPLKGHFTKMNFTQRQRWRTWQNFDLPKFEMTRSYTTDTVLPILKQELSQSCRTQLLNSYFNYWEGKYRVHYIVKWQALLFDPLAYVYFINGSLIIKRTLS